MSLLLLPRVQIGARSQAPALTLGLVPTYATMAGPRRGDTRRRRFKPAAVGRVVSGGPVAGGGSGTGDDAGLGHPDRGLARVPGCRWTP